MAVPRGINLRAAVLSARLLESDMMFHTVLYTPNQLFIHSQEPMEGTLIIDWTVTIDARTHGIESIAPRINKLVFDAALAQEDDFIPRQAKARGHIHFEYPELSEPVVEPAVGGEEQDDDAPTPDAIRRFSTWKVELSSRGAVDRHRGVYLEAEVFVNRGIIDITF